MNKFILFTLGRTASTSTFNCIFNSLKADSPTALGIDRGIYERHEWQQFNDASHSVFTFFNATKVKKLQEELKDHSEWCLLLVSRKDFAAWLLSNGSYNTTNKSHPGKDYVIKNLAFNKEQFMLAYWNYKCWEKAVYEQADTFDFGRVIRIDFDDLISDWSGAGKLINNWDWTNTEALMELGPTTSWQAVENIDEVLSWIPTDDQQLIDNIKKQL